MYGISISSSDCLLLVYSVEVLDTDTVSRSLSEAMDLF